MSDSVNLIVTTRTDLQEIVRDAVSEARASVSGGGGDRVVGGSWWLGNRFPRA